MTKPEQRISRRQPGPLKPLTPEVEAAAKWWRDQKRNNPNFLVEAQLLLDKAKMQQEPPSDK